MDKVNSNYSLKNIPSPSNDTYRKNLIQKEESFIKRIRWKAFFFERQCQDSNQITTNFGFKSVKTPSKSENFNQFESDLYDMVQNIQCKKLKPNFQMQLPNDVKNIPPPKKKLLVPADKTNNLCKITTKE